MKPESDSSEGIKILHRVRQQLILAQVRIMELEDATESLSGKLTDTQKLLAEAQLLADHKIDEASHLTNVCDELQTRAESSIRERGDFHQQVALLRQQSDQLNSTISRLNSELSKTKTTAAGQLERIKQLEAEIQTMKAAHGGGWSDLMRLIKRCFGSRKR